MKLIECSYAITGCKIELGKVFIERLKNKEQRRLGSEAINWPHQSTTNLINSGNTCSISLHRV